VAFNPNPNMPIYCRECWSTKKEHELYPTRKDKWAWEGLAGFSLIYGIVVGIFLEIKIGFTMGGLVTSFLVSPLVFFYVVERDVARHVRQMRITKLRLARCLLGINCGILVAAGVWYSLGVPFMNLGLGGELSFPLNYVYLAVGMMGGFPLYFACVGIGLLASALLDYAIRRIVDDTAGERLEHEGNASQTSQSQEPSISQEKKPIHERGYIA
jgi:hypothetical protein